MAKVVVTMSSCGVEPACPGCDIAWQRGSRMNAVQYDDGKPAGWWCDVCIAKWRATGRPPEDGDTNEQTT